METLREEGKKQQNKFKAKLIKTAVYESGIFIKNCSTYTFSAMSASQSSVNGRAYKGILHGIIEMTTVKE